MKGENQMKYNCCGRPTPVLPSVYQETLTYGETLGIVAQKINECVDEVNANDKKVDDLTNLVGTFDNRITDNTNAITAEQTARKDEDDKLTAELNDVKSTITTLEGNIDDNTSAISKETEDRQLADNELLTAINKEVSDRKLADSEIKEYVNNNCANAVKGNVTSTVVSVSDVSPLEHNVKVKVSSSTIDLTTVQVTRSRKNVFDAANAAKVSGASGFTNSNGVITVTQSDTGKWASANVPLSQGLAGSTITITCKSVVSGVNGAAARIQWVTSAGGADGDLILGHPDGDGNITATGVVPSQPDAAHNTLCLMLYSNTNAVLASGTVYTATYSNIQIEIGGTATAYTPYQGQTYKPKADGTVSGVTSLSPNMTLITDKVGVVLDVTYNRDINTNQGDITSIGNNTFTGTNAFNGTVTVPIPTADNQAATKKYVDDSVKVKAGLSTANTFSGSNTFNGRVIVPKAPATNNDVANKLYVDTEIINLINKLIPVNINKTTYSIFDNVIVFHEGGTIEDADIQSIVGYFATRMDFYDLTADMIYYVNGDDMTVSSLTELKTSDSNKLWWLDHIEAV